MTTYRAWASAEKTAEVKATSFQEQVIVNVLQARTNGQINDATVDFAEEFRFKDHKIELEFNNTKALTEFFQKAREFHPDCSVSDRNYLRER